MRLNFIACKYTVFIRYGKMIEYFFVKPKENLAEMEREGCVKYLNRLPF